MNVNAAIDMWLRDGVITAQKAEELRSSLKKAEPAEHTNRGVVVFSTIGAILVGLGVILFVGSNWSEMGPWLRAGVLALGYAVICAGGYVTEKRGVPRVAESLWFLSVLMLGANIFLLAQIFHFSLTFWQGPALWLIGTLAMGFARQKHIYGAMSVPLLLLTIGWLGGGSGWFMDDQMEFLFADSGLRPILSVIGVGLMSASILFRESKNWTFLYQSWFGWGTLLLTVPLIAGTAVAEVIQEFFQATFTVKQIILIVLSVLVSGSAITMIVPKKKESAASLAIALVLSLIFLIPRMGEPWLGYMIESSGVLFALYIIMMFMFSLLAIWVGIQVQNKHMVNAGIVSVSIIILIQYFSWSFEMLHSSVAFIVGGIVLIALSVFMERTRRHLLSRLQS